MKFSFPILSLCLSLIALTACDEDYAPKEVKNGTLDLQELKVDVQNDPLVIESRANDQDVSSFLVSIINTSIGDTILSTDYASLPASLTLPTGSYSILVRSHKPLPIEWEKPYFEATKTFAIKADETTTIGNMTCTFSAVKVTVNIAPDLLRRLEGDASTKVECGNNTVTFVQDETRAAYFVPAKDVNTLITTFTATIKGQKIEFRKIFGDIAPGQHRKITLYSKNGSDVIPAETGSIAAKIQLDATMSNEEINSNLDVQEEIINPTPDKNHGEITFSSKTIDFNKINSVNAESYIVHIHADDMFSHLKVKIETDNDNFFMAVTDLLPQEFDLVYPNGRDEDFKSLGLPIGDELLGKTDTDVDISQFVPLLQAYPGTHKFIITVDDMKGYSESRTLIFQSL